MVRNGGTTEISSFKVEFSYQTGATPESFPIAIVSVDQALPPGGTVTVQATWTPNVDGNPLPVAFGIDPEGSLGDVDPADNLATLGLTIASSVLPNLAVGPASLVFDRDPPLQGQPCQVTATIANPTANDAGAFAARLWLAEPGTGILLGEQTFAGLTAGETIDLVAIWDVDEPDDRLAYVVVDGDGTLAEFNEDDNQAFQESDVQTLPDLAVTSGGVSFSPDFPRVSDYIHFDVLVRQPGRSAGATGLPRAARPRRRSDRQHPDPAARRPYRGRPGARLDHRRHPPETSR